MVVKPQPEPKQQVLKAQYTPPKKRVLQRASPPSEPQEVLINRRSTKAPVVRADVDAIKNPDCEVEESLKLRLTETSSVVGRVRGA